MWPLARLVCLLAVTGTQIPAIGTDAEKFDAAREFVRARNARDYAITTANGIDEAKYVELGRPLAR